MNNYHYDYNYNYDPGNSPGPGPGAPAPGPGPGGRPPKNDLWDTLSWVIDVGLIFVCFPLGLFLTIANSMGQDIIGSIIRGFRAKSGSSAAAGRSAGAAAAQTAKTSASAEKKQAQPRQNETKTASAKPEQEKQAQPRPTVPGQVRHADAGSKVKSVFGWILVGFGVIGAFTAAGSAGTVWGFLTYIATMLGGGALLLSAQQSRRKEAKFRRCLTISGSKGIVNIAKLTKTLGIDPNTVDKMLIEMVDRGFYGVNAYIDHQRGLLVIDPADMRDVYRQEDEAHAAQKAQSGRTTQSIYDQYVEKIHQADVEIDDEVMSEKIRRMQTTTAAIFKEVEEHPEKKSQITRFMNYYLPTTLKLLDSYAHIEKQGVSGENMAKAKADIERIADTLVEGYDKQLDTLYRAEAMDIAGDVSVIENMMRRDGLKGQNDFGQTAGGH